MFGWFRPRCPVDLHTRLWCEESVVRLIQEVGESQFRDFEMIRPSDPRFKGYDGSREAVQQLFDLICDIMGANSSDIDFELIPDDEPFPGVERTNSFAGLYQSPNDEHPRPCIWLRVGLRRDPQRLIATMAHEIAHHVTFIRWPHYFDDPDMEVLTDLLPMLFGLGIFMANSAFRYESWNMGNMSSWAVSRVGYLDAESFGYALAVIAYLREDEDLTWANELTATPYDFFRLGHKFLRKTADQIVDPKHLSRTIDWTRDRLREELESKLPCRQLRALNQIYDDEPEGFAELVVPFLRTDIAEHRAVAGALVVRSGGFTDADPAYQAAFTEALDLITDPESIVRNATMWSLNESAPENVVDYLLINVTDSNLRVATVACMKLAQRDHLPPSVMPGVLPCLQ